MKKILLAGALAIGAAPAFADSTVHVFLWDAMSSMDMTDTHKIEDHANRLEDAMGIAASATAIPAGPVTFVVTNTASDAAHEMVVSKLSAPDATLPYDPAAMRVDETAAGSVGEVAELAPGATGTLSVALEPGTYALYCNVPGHYAAGMWTLVTVE